MNSKNIVRTISAILIILIVVVGVMLWSRHNPRVGNVFNSKHGFTISLPSDYKTYEDNNGMIAFPTLKFPTGSSTLDYTESYAANKKGISIVAMLPADEGVSELLFGAMTQRHATSTLALPTGASSMKSDTIFPSNDGTALGQYRGENYVFMTARGVYLLNVFSTGAVSTSTRTSLAEKILASFTEL